MKSSDFRKARRRQRRFAALAVLLGTTLALGVLEAGVRLLAPAWLEQRMRELSAGGSYEAGSDERWPAVRENGAFRQFVPRSRFVTRHYEYEHAVTLDELGGRATPHGPHPGALVPFLGDSFTFGVGVGDSETFLSLLAAESPFRLLNLGVPGSALHDHLNMLEMRHAELQTPSLYVFVVFMGNDLADVAARHERRSGGGGGGGSGGGGWLFRANVYVFHHPLLKRLYAVQYLRQKALVLMNRDGAGYMPPVVRLMRTDRTHLEDSLAPWREELGRLRAMSGTLGFRYVFLLIPDVHQLDRRRLAAKSAALGLDRGVLEPDRLSRAFTETLDELEIRYFDLEPCLSRAPTEGMFYVQDNHFTAAGHAVAAECVRESGLMETIVALVSAGGPEDRASP